MKKQQPELELSQLSNLIEEQQAKLQALIAETQERIARVEHQKTKHHKRVARGTGSPQGTDIETFLRSGVHTTEQVRAVVGPLADAELARLSRESAIHNLGTPKRPLWCWRIGDETSTKELTDYIRQLISVRPMTLAELEDATGARRNRISGQLVDLREMHGKKMQNLGTRARGLWWFDSRA